MWPFQWIELRKIYRRSWVFIIKYSPRINALTIETISNLENANIEEFKWLFVTIAFLIFVANMRSISQ